MSEHEIRTALTYIDAQNRDVWVKVGTALKTEFGESGFALFDEWSSQASNYRLNDAKTAFKSFQIGKSNIGYLINQAKQNGWQREKPQGLDPDEIRQREERNAQIAKQAEIERQEKAFQAALFAQNVWKNAKTADKNHPYLQRKGITHPAVLEGIRQEKEALIIPLKNHGEIVGIQKIFADGNKRFNRDIEKKGSAFVIGNRDEMHHGFLLAEGFATAATLHQATEKPVVVAFDAGNLQSVAQNLKAFVEKQHTPVLICADKDESQTGETKAMLAKKVLGDYAQVVLPDFSEAEIQKFQAAHNGKKPTDFNDLQAIAGIERVQNALSGCLKDDKLTLENTNESVTMDNEIPKPERSEWEKDFPKAITNGHLGNLKQDPDYQAAKAGDTDCAFNMVERLLKDETIEQMIEQFQPRRDNTVLLPVLAEENTGNNKIPLAVAQIISERTGIPCCETVFQTNHIGRTQKNADSRLLFHATFGGEVEKGKNYILIDDTLTMGGTMASLRSFVLQNGGNVSGVMVMSAQERSLQLAPTAEMIDNIRTKYGENIEEILKQELGYGLQELTNSEAAHILTYENAHTLRTRLAQTRYVESSETIETVGSKQELENLQIAQLTLSLREMHHPKAIIKNEPSTSLCKGEIVHIDDNFIIQRVDDNSRYFQKWNKQDLGIPIQVGDKARIYIDKQGKAQVKIIKREPSQNDEIPRPPQGGFVLPVENSNTNNRQAESISKENTMAEQNKLTASPPLEKQTFQPDTWQPENWQPDENAIDFNNDKPIVLDEVARQETQPEMTPQEKVQAAFETLQNQYNGYRYNPETQKVEVLESKTGEEIHYQADVEKLIYSAVDNGERKTIGDIDIKDLTPEYLALSVENRRLAYNQTLLQNGFPNEEKRQELDQTADRLDESIREAKRKTETLSPPVAPPPPLDQRYTAVERKFMDNATEYGDRTNLGIKTRVDYVDVNNSRTVLFSDKGNKLTTSKNPDAQTVKDMVEVAKAKGWDSVKLKGNKDFKRMAFIELESQGIKSKGYSPTPEDLSMVERLREERSLSAIENTSSFRQPEKHRIIAKEANERINPISTNTETHFSDSLNKQTATTEQAVGGILLAHGKENYQFQKDANPSYYATIQYPDGEKTHWGKDIERLLQEQNINIGDRIELQKTGKIENVRVEEVLRDEQGEPILDENGQPQYEEVMHQRNVWEVNVYQHSSNETTSSLNKSASTSKKQSFEQVQHDYNQAKATLSPKQQEYLAVAERLLHHAFEKGRISSHTQEYYLGNFYRHTTAEIKNGTIDIPNPYTKSSKVSKTQSINKPKTQTKGVDI